MDDELRTQADLLMHCGIRSKPWYDMCRTTKRQEFINRMKTWLGDDLPQNHAVFFYDKRSKKMIQLDDNEPLYLAPVFDSNLVENLAVGVQPLLSDGHSVIELFISAQDSFASSSVDPEAFAALLCGQLDGIAAKSVDSTAVNDLVSSKSPSWSTDTELLLDELSEQDLPKSNSDIPRNIKSSFVAPHISPTTNIKFQLSEHLRMKHDVNSTPPRRCYLSNMGKKGTGKLAYLSGVKEANDKGKQIRPIILIPAIVLEWLRENVSVKLVVACVRETQENDVRVWWIDRHSEFRMKGCTKDTPGVNPLQLSLTLEKIKNRNFKLEVYLNRVPRKINTKRKGELFYSLDNAFVNQLHKAPHDSQSSRLAFLVSSDDILQMNTVGFSNFIREPKCTKKTASVRIQDQPVPQNAQTQPQMVTTAVFETAQSNQSANPTE